LTAWVDLAPDTTSVHLPNSACCAAHSAQAMSSSCSRGHKAR
jgi:hypothetical protein